MKYKVIKTKQAENEYNALTPEQRVLLDDDYRKIEEEDLARVSTKKIEKAIFEIRTENIRSLYTYRDGAIIIVVTIFIKKTQKTPEQYKVLARKRIKNLGDNYHG